MPRGSGIDQAHLTLNEQFDRAMFGSDDEDYTDYAEDDERTSCRDTVDDIDYYLYYSN